MTETVKQENEDRGEVDKYLTRAGEFIAARKALDKAAVACMWLATDADARRREAEAAQATEVE